MTTQAAVSTVKEKIPFFDDDMENEVDDSDARLERYVWSEKAQRFRDRENGRFVSRETALGRTAVAQVIAPPTPRSKHTQHSVSTSTATPSKKIGVFGPMPEEADLEALWKGSGRREMIAKSAMDTDPVLYLRYVAARDAFITSQVTARGARISEATQKTHALGRLRSKLQEGFRRDASHTQTQPEAFDSVYEEVLKAALAPYGHLSLDEQYARRRELEADAGYALEWDVSKKKVKAGDVGKFSLRRKAIIYGGLLLAGGIGAATGVWERMQKGEHDVRFLGAAALLGAAVGFGAAKASQPLEDDVTVSRNADTARKAIEDAYGEYGSTGSFQEAVGVESVKDITRRDKRRALGRTALGIGGGALVGAGGHLLVDMWPMLAQYLPGSEQDISIPSDTPIDVTPETDAVSEVFNPLDTDHNGVVNAQDMPDVNHDGVINSLDHVEVYDPLDTNHDGAVNEIDMPDVNQDGTIDQQDQTETHDSPDTQHDHNAGEQDDTNGGSDASNTPEEVNDQAVDSAVEEPTELPAQVIYIEPGSGITHEFHQYIYDTYGVDMSDNQLNNMYIDLIESGHYTPEQLFGGVDFYTMEDGRWGMRDTGPAELTGTGRAVIIDWLHTNGLGE